MTKETQTAVNTAELNVLKKSFDEHCKKQNNTQEKTVIAIDKIREEHQKGLTRVYNKIDERDKKSITKWQAIMFAILTSVVSALIIYVLMGK